MNLLPVRLGPKINAMALAFLILLGLVTAGLLLFGFERTQDSARNRSREGLVEQAKREIQGQADTNAFAGNVIVDEAVDSAREAAGIMSALPDAGAVAPYDAAALATGREGQRYDANPLRKSDVLVPATVPVDATVERDLRDSAALDAVFPSLMSGMPDAIAIFFTSTTGVTRYYPPVGVADRMPAAVIPDVDRILRLIGPEQNPARESYWTPPYEDSEGLGLVLTAYIPVYEANDYRGMIGVDMSLARLLRRVDEIRLPSAPSSFAFVIDREGEVLPGNAVDRVTAALQNPGPNAGFSGAVGAMRGSTGGVEVVRFEGRDVFIGYAPLGAVGGSLAVIAPVDEVTSQSEAVAAEIGDEGNLTIGVTLSTMFAFFLLALAAAAWQTRRSLVQPINALVKGTREVAAGNLTTRIPVNSGDELGVLAESFNSMTGELARSRSMLEEERSRTAASEAELSALFAAMTDVVLVVDVSGRYIRQAPTNPEKPYRPQFDLVGLKLHDVWPTERADWLLGFVRRAVETGEPQYAEYSVADSGVETWYLAVVSHLRDDQALVVSRDITSRKQDEQTLAAREAELRALFSAMTDTVVVMDRDGRYLRAAQTRRSQTYNLPEEAIGRTIEEVMPADVAPQLLSTLKEAIDTGSVRQVEYRLPVDRMAGDYWFSAVISPMTPDTALVVGRDITSRKLAEQELAEREAQYRSIFEETTDALFITTLEGVLVDANPAAWRMHGYEREEFLRLSPLQFIHPDDLAVFGAYLEQVAAGGRFHGRARDVRKDGSIFDVEVVGTRIMYRGRAHVLGVVRDITERVQGERLLERRVAERTRELASLLEVSRNVASTLELPPLLELILDEVNAVAPFDRAAFMLLEDEQLVSVATRDVDRERGLRELGTRFPVAGRAKLWDVVRGGEAVLIGDVRGEGDQAEAWRHAVGNMLDTWYGDITSWMAVPVALQDRAIGMLSLSRSTPNAYNERHAQLASAICSQAAVALENARLFKQTEERTRELASLLEVSRKVGSTLELQPLLELILDAVNDVAHYDRAAFMILDGDQLVNRAARDNEPGAAAAQIGLRFSVGGRAALWERLTHGEPVIIEDVQGDTELARGYRGAMRREGADVGPLRSWMAVPLALGDRMIGMLAIACDTPGFYTPRHAELASAIASQAAIAFENARLFEESEERSRELATLLEVSTEVASTLDFEPLLRVVLQQMSAVAEHIRASLFVLDGDELIVMESQTPRDDAGPIAGMRIPVSAVAQIWEALQRRQPVYVHDVQQDDSPIAREYRRAAGQRLDSAFKDVRGWMGVPLALQDRIIGAITLSSDRIGFYQERHGRVAMTIANQAAVAIENARLYREAEQSSREMAGLLDVSRAITSKLELRPLVASILEQLRNVVDYGGASVLMLDSGGAMSIVDWQTPGLESTAPLQIERSFSLSRAPSLTSALDRGEAMAIHDVTDDSEISRQFRDTVGEEMMATSFAHTRAWMGAPIRVHDRTIGLIGASSPEPGFFTPARMRLVSLVANQAAVAIENSRLYEESERRAREMEALTRADAELFRSLDVDTVLAALADVAVDVMKADASILTMTDGGTERVRASRAISAEGLEMINAYLEAEGPSRHSVGIFALEDVSEDPRPATRALWLHEGFASYLAVPMKFADRLIGGFGVGYRQPHAFADSEKRIIQRLANQAAVAIENARLYEQAEARTRELTALLEISKDLTSTLELRSLLTTVLDEMKSIADYDRSSILVLDGNELETVDFRSDLAPPGSVAVGGRIPLKLIGPAWERIKRGEVVFVDNVREEGNPYADAYRAVAGNLLETVFKDIRSWLGVPLAVKDRVIGMMTLSKNEPGFYGERHARLITTIANQAAVAIENARLYEEAEQRAKEMSALLEISGAIASTLELRPLVGLILDQLKGVIEYHGASLLIMDDKGVLEIVDARALTGVTQELGLRFRVEDAEPMWRVIGNQQIMVINDVKDDGEQYALDYRRVLGRSYEMPAFQAVRSWMGVPLAVQGRVIGMMSMSRTEPGYFTETHTRLARAIADQVAVAVENARLFEESRRRAREMEALTRADTELFSSLNLNDVLQALVDVSIEVLGADISVVTLWEGHGFGIRAARNMSPLGIEAMAGMYRGFDIDTAQRVLQRGSSIIVSRDQHMPVFIPILEIEDVESTMDVPILREGEAIGRFGIGYRRRHEFAEDEQRQVWALAERVSVAMANAELYERAQQAASLEERARLARELHDSVSQALYGIALGARTARTQLDRDPVKAIEPVEYVMSLAEAGLAEMRALIFELRPESLELEGLVAGLQKQAAALKARHAVDVDLDLCPEPDAPLPVKEAVSRIAQEALHNTVKHARASHVTLSLCSDDGTLTLSVEDDGRGFDTSQPFAGHLGLRSMRERTAKLGGQIEIESAPGAGARIRVSIPVHSGGGTA